MYAQIFKVGNSAGAKKSWLHRSRAIQHKGYIQVPAKTPGKTKAHNLGWENADGTPLTEEQQKQIASVAIPAGWTNVRLNKNPKADLIAMGTDTKGKTQPKYSVEHTDQASIKKFARVAKLNPEIPRLQSRAKRDMNNDSLSDRARDDAATLYLISRTGFRPGGSSSDAYGASTLEKRHIKVEGNVSHFTFVGKHQVNQNKRLTDKDLATYLNGKLAKLKANDTVFASSGASVGKYMKSIVGSTHMVKDLRTWNGTAMARHLINAEPVPSNAKELASQQKRISEFVSAHLGNTPAVALKSYIDPLLWKHTGDLTIKEK